MAKPTQAHLNMAKNVLQYLQGSREKILSRQSITGYNFQLTNNGPLISWKSHKQQTVALSTCEAEYISLANAVQEAKFLKQLCNEVR